jgi:4a-hydroxytetrahydrobiopterin dehydratase
MKNTKHDNWLEGEFALVKDFEFANFKKAVAFVNAVAELAEQAEHHPDIAIHDYNKVRLTLTTHEGGRLVTDKDRSLAAEIDTLSIE